ncbi:MAG: hypothetical protein ABIH04_09180, partial [Planctomycetota bacterium]
MAYGGLDQIYYAERNSGIWNETLVQDNDNVSSNAARRVSQDCLAFDLSGNEHIAYAFETAQAPGSARALKHAYQQNGVWTLETVASIDSGYYYNPAIIFDSSDVPHIIAFESPSDASS